MRKSHTRFVGRNAEVVLRSSPQLVRLPSIDVVRMDQAEEEFNAQLDVPEFHPENYGKKDTPPALSASQDMQVTEVNESREKCCHCTEGRCVML